MPSVTQAHFSARWTSPVVVSHADAARILGPGDALRFMNSHFKRQSGPLYWRARSLCFGALIGEVHPEMARPHFVAAYAAESLACDNR